MPRAFGSQVGPLLVGLGKLPPEGVGIVWRRGLGTINLGTPNNKRRNGEQITTVRAHDFWPPSKGTATVDVTGGGSHEAPRKAPTLRIIPCGEKNVSQCRYPFGLLLSEIDLTELPWRASLLWVKCSQKFGRPADNYAIKTFSFAVNKLYPLILKGWEPIAGEFKLTVDMLMECLRGECLVDSIGKGNNIWLLCELGRPWEVMIYVM